ncbi:molybdate-anion transporter [Iris pallida]|uniref:Molybdate-anion transporter n=1 Tax=Iris pallida TaxID=29817 RepID=A0AAX6DZV9_IRIPA|nr:molybdate-anion transporter [Iris pallida]KAJ6799703.1 molybdate-anion transporter [Iris pallida]
MAVVIPKEEWELSPFAYVFLFLSCSSSVFLPPCFSRKTSAPAAAFDAGPTAPFLRFQRSFLFIYSLASVMEGLELVFGEQEFAKYGFSREQMALCLAAGAAAALFLGTFSGILADVIGPEKACLLFYVLHFFVGILKSISSHPSIWVTGICLSLASSLFSFSFETWMVTEHEKQGHRQELLSDTFWLMIFLGSASLIVSQALANLLVKDLNKAFLSPYTLASLLAMTSVLYMRKGWNGARHQSSILNYKKAFTGHILKDKKLWLLAWAQTSIHFSMSVFWILWAPTIVADGRDVSLSHIYPCFLGSRMLGSSAFPWVFGGSSSLRSEDCLISVFVVAGLSLLIVAYDYQEIGLLVVLFCIFQACVGLILPALARLRTIYVPNELRGGMISLSLAPANAAILIFLIQGGYHHNIENAAVMVLSALGLLSAAGCIHLLRRWKKQPRQNWHKL